MASILVVDDSMADRALVGKTLEAVEEYDIAFAENGEEALAEIERTVPDLVVTDLFMPKLDGLELVSRARQEFPLVPVVLITSKGSEELAVQALQQGAASYVPKRLVSRYLPDTVCGLLSAVEEQRRRATLLGSMRSDSCEFSLENDLSLAHAMVGYVLESMSHIGIGDEVSRMRTGVALQEAIVNAMHHGNLEVDSSLREHPDNAYDEFVEQRRQEAPYCHRRVRVQVEMSHTRAAFVVSDEGPGFRSRESSRSEESRELRTGNWPRRDANANSHGRSEIQRERLYGHHD